MSIGLLNIVTSPEGSKWVQDSAFQVLSEGSLKAAGRPIFTLMDKNAAPAAKRYSAVKEFLFQSISMIAYFALITTIVQNGGFHLLKKMPQFKEFGAIKDIKSFKDFSHVFDSFQKGLVKVNEKEATELEKTKGGMELIKMIGSGVILTILCPILVTKMVHPIMNLGSHKKTVSNKETVQQNTSGDTFTKTEQTK